MEEPPKVKSKPKKTASKGLTLYGATWKTRDRAKIELRLIEAGGYLKHGTKTYGNGLEFHVKAFQKIAWPWKHWHRWNEQLILPTICQGGRVAIFGPASCVRGDTRIDDPVTGERPTIESLCLAGKAPTVMTLKGPRVAGVPFIKGRAELFEVSMTSGNCFRATAKHLVMLESGSFVRVEQLRSGDRLKGVSASRPLSISGNAPLAPVEDVLSSKKTALGFRFDCRPCPCFGDEQSQKVKEACQELVPSQVDVLGHSLDDLPEDGLFYAEAHNRRYQCAYPLSKPRNARLNKPSEIAWSLRCDEETPKLYDESSPLFFQSWLKTNPDRRVEEPILGFDCRLHASNHRFSYPCKEYSIQPDTVSRVTGIGMDVFYDLTVPDVHHYFAEGLIHHNSGKSVEAVFFTLTMFYAHPDGTTAICSSTTLESLEGRIWGYVKEFHKKARAILPWLPGHLIESKQKLLADAKDEESRDHRNGVFGVACRRGGQWRGLEEFVGRKNDVMILCADETSFMEDGFWDAAANLESNLKTWIIALGNLGDLDSPLAKAAEPLLGWESLPDSDVSRIYQTRWYQGKAVQLIGKDSPNFDYPEGQEPFKKLIGREFIKRSEHNYGVDTPLYHMFVSGKIPRGTLERRILKESDCYRNRAFEPPVWGHEKVTWGYMMDAAYSGIGGDRTVGAPFAFGKDNEGKWIFAIMENLKVYRGSQDALMKHEDAIALDCKAECERLNIPPEHVFYDGTGRASLTISFARLWSAKVNPVEFGGPATERPGFAGQKFLFDLKGDKKAGDVMLCRDLYDRFVTELWFALAACIVSGQFRGMREEVIKEGSRRLWNAKGMKCVAETKDEMRKRTTRSPDLVDCVVTGLEGARRLGFPLGSSGTGVVAPRKTTNWIRHVAQGARKDAQEELLVAT